ncbi:MAG: hypothetical protein JWO58_25 [Chitinophagaceae bacterium]|nr:hypothetical protein [Chitinophagaceae bacterium]
MIHFFWMTDQFEECESEYGEISFRCYSITTGKSCPLENVYGY